MTKVSAFFARFRGLPRPDKVVYLSADECFKHRYCNLKVQYSSEGLVAIWCYDCYEKLGNSISHPRKEGSE
jgi:hypothetical protein